MWTEVHAVLPRGGDTHVFVDRAPADDGAHGAALHPRLVERRVAAFRFQFVAVENPGHVRVDHHHVGLRAGPQRAAGQAEQFRGLGRQRFEQRHQLELAVVHQPERRRQHGLDADGAGGGLGERQALDLDVLRIVVGHHHVDQPAFERLDQRPAVVLVAQRRRHLEEGAVVADVDLVQRQMVDRGGGGDRQGPASLARRSTSSDSAQVMEAAW